MARRRGARSLIRSALAGAAIVAGAGAGTLSAPVQAEEPEAEGTYAVELIVFRQWEQGGRHAERWPSRVPPPRFPRWQVPDGCDAPAASAGGEVAMRCLPPQQRGLRSHWDRLSRAEAYQPLYHLAWRQPGLREDHAVAVPVPLYWRPDPEALAPGAEASAPTARPPVYGLVRIYRERYLHVITDLRLQRVATGQEPEAEELLRAPEHRMTQHRRMRSGELHYLDHPAIGVLVRITELED